MAEPKSKRPKGYDYTKEFRGGKLPGPYSDYIQVPRSWLDSPKTDASGKQPKTNVRQPDYAIVGKIKPGKTTIGTGPNKAKVTPIPPAKAGSKGLPKTGKTNVKKK